MTFWQAVRILFVMVTLALIPLVFLYVVSVKALGWWGLVPATACIIIQYLTGVKADEYRKEYIAVHNDNQE